MDISPDHRCGCHTIPDADGYHHRPGEVPEPDDETDEVDPRDALTPDEWIDRLANALHRADPEGHGHFENAIDAGNWLWEEEEDLV